MQRHKSFAHFIAAPENRSAMLAMQDLASGFDSRLLPNPLLLHGPSGTGKSHLVSALVHEITRGNAGLVIDILEAGAFSSRSEPPREPKTSLNAEPVGFTASPSDMLENARTSDLLVVEDLQHLPLGSVEALVQVIDHRLARQRPMVFTARSGPQHLGHRGERFANRLTSRLAAGLAVGLQPLQPASRLLFLEDQAQRRQLPIGRAVLAWLADNLTGGSRQLEGALNQLELLSRHERGLDIDTVSRHLQVQVEASRPTVERIAQRVSGYFRVEARQLQSRRRYRNILLPRQIGMFLARQLTSLSLEQIGAYFGGRDHSTVLHACHKVKRAMNCDAVLSGAVRQIHADLA